MDHHQQPANVWNDARITAYVLNELSPSERDDFERLLAGDPVLQESVRDARRVIDEVTRFLESGSGEALSTARRSLVCDAMEADPAPSRPIAAGTGGQGIWDQDSGGHSVASRWKPWAIAAALLVAFGFGVAIPRPQKLRELAQSPARDFETRSTTASSIPSNSVTNPTETTPAAASSPSSQSVVVDRRESLSAVPSGESIASPESRGAAVVAGRPGQHDAGATPFGLDASGPAGPRGGAAPKGRNASSMEAGMGMAPGMGMGGAGMGMGGYPGAGMSLGRAKGFRGFELSEEKMPGSGPVGGTVGVGAPREALDQLSVLPHDSPDLAPQGRGPGSAGDRFEPITDNPFQRVTESPLSTFSIDVDTASYSKMRQFLLEAGQLPRPDAVRIEELVNYFDYQYAPPAADHPHPFAVHVEVTQCPWQPKHRLARIALKGREIAEERPRANLVFLLDVSGSMNEPNKLPLVIRGMRMLVGQLFDHDRVAIVVYAGAAGMVLDSTPAEQRDQILDALDRLQAGGSTNGGQGIRLAYQVARDHFIPGGTNRVILCTDGDFNVGTTGTDELVRLVESEAKDGVFLSVLGFGMGNHNDAMLEQISNRGNGNHAFIDTPSEARKVLVHQISSTLVTIAKDVKIQVEFNPRKVGGYRLIGYENRVLAAQDFNDDKKDAGEIGAGHSVTALYELAPAGDAAALGTPPVDPLKYQTQLAPSEAASTQEWLTVKLRYKQPDEDKSTLLEQSVSTVGPEFGSASEDLRFAAAVASFGMQLRGSPYKGSWSWNDVRKTAQSSLGADRFGHRSEFLELVQTAEQLATGQK